jgi:hypothetical protein
MLLCKLQGERHKALHHSAKSKRHASSQTWRQQYGQYEIIIMCFEGIWQHFLLVSQEN